MSKPKPKWLKTFETLLFTALMLLLAIVVIARWKQIHAPETAIDEMERPAVMVLSSSAEESETVELAETPEAQETPIPEETAEPVEEPEEPEPVAVTLAVEVEPEPAYNANIPLPEYLQIEMRNACNAFDVPYALALAITEAESGFQLDADNGICWGPMQIHPCNYGWLRERGIEPTTYAGNIQAGVLMISQLLSRYGDTHLALMAYNAGEGGAQTLWAQGIYSSAYSRQITSRQAYWQDIIDN